MLIMIKMLQKIDRFYLIPLCTAKRFCKQTLSQNKTMSGFKTNRIRLLSVNVFKFVSSGMDYNLHQKCTNSSFALLPSTFLSIYNLAGWLWFNLADKQSLKQKNTKISTLQMNRRSERIKKETRSKHSHWVQPLPAVRGHLSDRWDPEERKSLNLYCIIKHILIKYKERLRLRRSVKKQT